MVDCAVLVLVVIWVYYGAGLGLCDFGVYFGLGCCNFFLAV